MYLPNRPDLVTEQAKQSKTSEPPQLYFDNIEILLMGVHVAVISEAMSFCEKLGIDTGIMFDIVSNAAGSSEIFKSSFKNMQKAKWSLWAGPYANKLGEYLVSMTSTVAQRHGMLIKSQSESVGKANSIRYPVFLSSAALQEFYRQVPQWKSPV